MPCDPLNLWKDTLEKLKPSGDVTWAIDFAKWVDERVTNKLTVSGVSKSTFTFQKAVFATALTPLTPVADPVSGIKKFADAWALAMKTSTMIVPVGASLGAPTPATTWSVVSSVINPASIELGRAIILTLSAAPVAAKTKDSQFPQKFREAFLALKVDITGTNSVPPPAGPNPLPFPAATVK